MSLLPVWNREVYLSISPYLCQLCSQFEIIFFFSLECIVSLFPGWPLTLDSPASASLGLEVQACATLLDGS